MTCPLRNYVRIALVALLAVVGALSGAQARAALPIQHVLVIHTTYKGLAPFEEFQQSLTKTLSHDAASHVEVHTEFFDLIGPGGESYEQALSEYLRQKYASVHIDVIVPVTAPAARLAIRLRPSTFPDAAIVFGAIDHRVAEKIDFGGNATGVTGLFDIRRTVEVALRVRPGTERVAIVAGSSELERAWWSMLASESLAVDPNLQVIELTGLAAEDLLDRLASLPPRTIVLWAALFRDANGRAFGPGEALEQAHFVTNAPIYGLYGSDLGHGIVGGSLVNLADHGERTGALVLRVLGGEPASSILPIYNENNRTIFDWRELKRWNIGEDRLPPGAIVIFRATTTWEQYGGYIVGALLVFLAQSLLIAGLLVQRSRRLRAQLAVAERLEFERLISDLSNRISDVPADEVDTVITNTIEAARDLFGVDRLSLIQFEGEEGIGSVRHSAAAAEVVRLGKDYDFNQYPEMLAAVRRGELVRLANLEDATMPVTCAALGRSGVKSLAAVPLQVGGTALGILGIASLRSARDWSDELMSRVRILADIFANALGRRRDAEQMRKSEALSHAVLGSLTAQVCVVDRDNRVVAGNDAWQRSASSEPGFDIACVLFGNGCASTYGAAASCTNGEALRARDGIGSVISTGLPAFSMEYRTSSPTGDSWYLMTVERLRLPDGGAVVSNQNITPRKRAEFDAEQSRQELMHFSRVSAMGELAASLAHELNQPLTGVLTNAQAATRFLAADPPNVAEVREILDDIIEDDRRAGEVIRRLRAMLRSGSVEPSAVDVKDVVENVLKLLASDAILRDVTLESDIATGLPPIRGDRIQLQQVVLNLVVNAMDAMAGGPERRVTIRTMASDPQTVCVSVSDTGPGIESEKLGRIFQPFYTTKAEGLGMGLSIARTIVEAHGGQLWATNNPETGASFHVRVPIAAAEDQQRHTVAPVSIA